MPALAADEAKAVTEQLRLLVSAFNHRAQTCYTRQGFVELTQLPDVVRDGDDEILMRKRLA